MGFLLHFAVNHLGHQVQRQQPDAMNPPCVDRNVAIDGVLRTMSSAISASRPNAVCHVSFSRSGDRSVENHDVLTQGGLSHFGQQAQCEQPDAT